MKYVKNINPRLVAYCLAMGYKTLEEKRLADRSNYEFTAWNDKHWKMFRDEKLPDVPYPFYTAYGNEYDAWLQAKYPEGYEPQYERVREVYEVRITDLSSPDGIDICFDGSYTREELLQAISKELGLG